MFIDTHCHLNFKAFADDWQDVLQRALGKHVEMIVVSTDLKTSQKALEIAKSSSGVWAAVGFHPIHVIDRDWRAEILRIRELIKSPKVVAVGEVGFDRIIKGEKIENEMEWKKIRAIQEKIFEFFVEAAAEFDKPLILHCREALEVLQEKIESAPTLRRNVGGRGPDRSVGIQHCFPGDLALANKLFKHGLKIGFTGLVTYNPSWDELIRQVDLANILIETDSPFLTPVPYRGQRNEPAHVLEVAKHIAKIKAIDLTQVEKATYSNARQLFGLA